MIMRIAITTGLIAITAVTSWLWPRIDRPPSRFEIARQLLEQGRHKDAALLFEDPVWRGVAEYRAGRFERALGNFYSEKSALSLYNLGTTHARMQEWTHAAAILDQVLRLAPDHVDAKHNLDIALKAIAQARSEGGDNPREQPLDQEGDDKQDKLTDDPNQKSSQQTQPGNGDGTKDASKDKSKEQGGEGNTPGEIGDQKQTDKKGTAVAFGAPETQGERVEREVDRSTLLKARESTQAAEILLRHIHDDPEKVLRARLYRAYQAKKAAGQQ